MAKIILNSIIKHMTRGVLVKASELEKIVSYEKTNNEYLKLTNLENGAITGEMQYLTTIQDNFKKYCVQNNNLIISKIGYPKKVVVAQIEENENILVSGNMFILELDLDKVDPFYLASYFTGAEGQQKLLESSVGNFVSSIVTTKLKAMEIDLPDMDKQKEIGKKYFDTVTKIAELKSELAANIEKLGNLS